MTPDIEIYDTTLRDGTQGEGVTFSVADKLRIAERLDDRRLRYEAQGFFALQIDVERHSDVVLMVARPALRGRRRSNGRFLCRVWKGGQQDMSIFVHRFLF